jgi:hypothetical protein
VSDETTALPVWVYPVAAVVMALAALAVWEWLPRLAMPFLFALSIGWVALSILLQRKRHETHG